MEVYGIVLASGLSKRMGEQKLEMDWKGLPLIEHTLEKLSGIPFKEVKVVIPEQSNRLKAVVKKYEYTPILNNHQHLGMGYSLSLAFKTLPSSSEAAIILLGDQPTLGKKDIMKVFSTFKQNRSEAVYCPKIIIQMKYRDGKIGHPILFSHHFFDELRSLRSDIGGRNIIRHHTEFLYFCESDNEYPNDIDTICDYHQLLTLFSRNPPLL